MSCLALPNGTSNVSKAVISFWFRVPRATLESAKAAFKQQSPGPPFNGITPLLVFGDDSVQGYDCVNHIALQIPYVEERWFRTDPVLPENISDPDEIYGTHQFHTSPSFSGEWTSFDFVPGSTRKPKDPCYIGIDCNKVQTLPYDGETIVLNVLRINLQLSGVGSGTGMGYSNTLVGPNKIVDYGGTNLFLTPETTGTVVSMPVVYPPGYPDAIVIAEYNPVVTSTTYVDKSNVFFAGETERCIIKTNVEVTPDQWHHVLLSFDLTGSISASGRQGGVPPKGKITTNCKIWLAYDDKDINGTALLGGSFDPEYSERPSGNDLFTQNAASTARANTDVDGSSGPNAVSTHVETHYWSGFSKPSYTYAPSSISGPLGIPATSKYVNNVGRVEMAELQIFTGVTLDTSVAGNRRAFIDYKRDSKGKQIGTTLAPVDPGGPTDPKQKTYSAPTDPAKQPASEKLLGKKPDVLLHVNENWKVGFNTGATGVSIDPQTKEITKLPAGQFAPTGGILRYRPEPALGK